MWANERFWCLSSNDTGSHQGKTTYLDMMKHTLLSLALIMSAPASWAADMLPLSSISDYLNSIKIAETTFTQVDDDGTLSTGTLYLNRPGRMRFEYDPPNGAVVIAGGGTVVIHDTKSNTPPESYPLKRTPLSIILARQVNLGQANMVVGHSHDGTATVVTAQDPENPEYGSIDMMFTDAPVELRKWVIRDGQGGETTVILGPLTPIDSLNSNLFSTQTDGKTQNR